MVILAIHPLPEGLSSLRECIAAVYPEAELQAFTDPMLAIQFAYNNRVDSVYTFINMSRLSGFDLARLLWKKARALPIYYIAQTEELRRDAEAMHAAAYLVEPLTTEKLRAAVSAENGVSGEA